MSSKLQARCARLVPSCIDLAGTVMARLRRSVEASEGSSESGGIGGGGNWTSSVAL